MEKPENRVIESTQGSGVLKPSVILLAVICAGRVSNGMLISILGPTLLSLANNVGTGVSEVSYIFTSINAGILLGGLSVAYIREKVNRIYAYAICYGLMAVFMVSIPLTKSLWGILLIVFVAGNVYGYTDVGVQAMILQVWGEKHSRPHIALYHFMITIGDAVTPLIVRPFLEDTNAEDNTCHDNGEIMTQNTTDIYRNYTFTVADNPPKHDPVIFAYTICAVYTFIVAILFFSLGLYKVESKVRHYQETHIEKRKEDPISKIFPLLLLTCIYYFLCLSSEALFGSYVFAVGVCSELQIDPEDATFLNTLFWVGYGVARLILLYGVRVLKPRNIVFIGAIGCTITLILEAIWGKSVVWTVWVISFVFGFFVSLLFPGGILWTSQHTNMSGKYAVVFCVGASLGAIIMLPVGGVLFDIKPFYVMYLDLLTTVLLLFTFIAMVVLQKKTLGASYHSWESENGKNNSYEPDINESVTKL